ncbi:hypothetical protein AB0P17_36570 [Streptomyces sp. NPDC088124]|uniref:hypothetical protein n=1 Tax=Streptomyces sp. NPDC088124 TaxID=3154654 RepID=UPI00342FB769
MVDTPPPPGETLREIAARYGRSYETLRTLAKRPGWPTPNGRKGGAYTYDPADVDPIATAAYRRPAALAPRRLYTAREIATATGISAGTIRADRTKTRADGTPRWPAPDDTTGPAHRWYGRTVTAELERRHAYRRTTQ